LTARLLSVEDLGVKIRGRRGDLQILVDVSLELRAGEMHGLVGETGSGKSMTARAIVGLLPAGGRIVAGRVLLGDQNLVGLTEKAFRSIRGPRIAMIFQNPRTALHPLLSVRAQMGNVLKAHFEFGTEERKRRILEYLQLAGIHDPERVAHAYPHELSGGMAQRVVIATSLICEPEILIADEPTTGLDATVQRQILDELAALQEQLSLSVLMITHDLAVVAQYCDWVSVMNEGRVVEDGPMRRILKEPAAEYTQRLLSASQLAGMRDEVALERNG
jgi:ABC-type dipeptide/oligopeptide/nickel transport system ATPase component